MKKLILLAGFLFCFFSASAQIEFAPPGAVWYYGHTYSSWCCLHFDGYEKVYYDRDTMVNGVWAKVLKREVVGMVDNIIEESYLPEKIIYQDSQKIYIWTHDQFLKLYDFGAEAGDTIHLSGWGSNLYSGQSPCEVPFRVDSVYYEDFNGVMLKNLALNSTTPIPGYFPLINEKFGAIPAYLFEIETICYTDILLYRPFRCYEDDNFPRYQHDTIACDHFENVSDLVELADLKIEINPNPIQHFFQIKNENSEPYDLSVFNINGQLILQKNVIRESTFNINCQDWTSSTYFAVLNIGNQSAYKKMVKLP